MHMQAPCCFTDIAIALLVNPLDMFPSYPVRRHQVVGRWGQGFAFCQQRGRYVIGVCRFSQIIGGAHLYGGHGGRNCPISCQHDNPGIFSQIPQGFDHVQPIAVFQPQIDGSKTGLELPGIVDQVITMADIADANGQPQRAFVCQTLNPWGYPAKDRSGRLERVEAPHLGRLMEKIQRPAAPASERLTWPPVTPADPVPAQEPGHG